MSARLQSMARGPMAVVVLGLVLLAVLTPRLLGGGGGDPQTSDPIPLSDPMDMPDLDLAEPAVGDSATTTSTTSTLPPVERRNPFLPPAS